MSHNRSKPPPPSLQGPLGGGGRDDNRSAPLSASVRKSGGSSSRQYGDYPASLPGNSQSSRSSFGGGYRNDSAPPHRSTIMRHDGPGNKYPHPPLPYRDDHRRGYPPPPPMHHHPRDYHHPSSTRGDFYPPSSRPLPRSSDHGPPLPPPGQRDFGPPRMRSPSYMTNSSNNRPGPPSGSDYIGSVGGGGGSRSAPMDSRGGPPPLPFSRPSSMGGGGPRGPPPPEYGSRFPYGGYNAPPPPPGRYDSYNRPSMAPPPHPDSSYGRYGGPSGGHHGGYPPSTLMASKRMRSPIRGGERGPPSSSGGGPGSSGNPRSLLMSSRKPPPLQSNRRADSSSSSSSYHFGGGPGPQHSRTSMSSGSSSLISSAKRNHGGEGADYRNHLFQKQQQRDVHAPLKSSSTAALSASLKEKDAGDKNDDAGKDDDKKDQDEITGVATEQEGVEEEEEEKSDSDASSFEQEEVEMEIERVDNAIAKQERILATARAKIATAERIAREKAAGIESQEKVRQRLLPDSIMEEYRARHLEHITDAPASTSQLIGDIYSANRKLARVFQEKSKERDIILFNIGNLDLTCGDDVKEALKKLEPTPPVTPLLQEFKLEFNPMVRPILLSRIRQKAFEVQFEKESLVEDYREYEEEWMSRVEKMEAELEKNGTGVVSGAGAGLKPYSSGAALSHAQSVSNIAGTGILGGGGSVSASSPAFQAPGEDSAQSTSATAPTSTRSSRRSGFRSDVVRSEAEFQNALLYLGILPEESPAAKPFSSDKLAKEVEMVTDPDIIRQMKFLDHNNIVHDPEKELQDYNNLMEIKWSEYDKTVFKSKLMQYGKDFYKIASFLDQKSTHDCITYYYREKVNLRFKNLLRRSQSGRGRRKKDKNETDVAPPSFKTIMLMDDEELVPPAFLYSESEKSDRGDETDDQIAPSDVDGRKPFVLDPLSTPVSPLGSPTLVDQQNANWTEEEMQRALRGFELFGRDFHSVSSMIGTKTPYQCKAFFNNHRRHIKEEKELKTKESAPGRKKGKSGPGRKRTESYSTIQVENNLGVDGMEEVNHGDFGISSAAANEKKRKASEAGETNVKKSKKSDDSATAISGAAAGAEGTESQPRKTISYWSVSERADFMRLLPIHGKNFEAIAQDIQTKSAIQVRNYFHNSRKKLNLDAVLEKGGHMRNRSEAGGRSATNTQPPAPAAPVSVPVDEMVIDQPERPSTYTPLPPMQTETPIYHHPDHLHPPVYMPSHAASNDSPQHHPRVHGLNPPQDTGSIPVDAPYIPPVQDLINRSPIKSVVPRLENLLGPNSSPEFVAPPLQYTNDGHGDTTRSYIPAAEPSVNPYKPSDTSITEVALNEVKLDDRAGDAVVEKPIAVLAVGTNGLDELESGQVVDESKSIPVDDQLPPVEAPRKSSVSISGLVNPETDVDGEDS